MSVFWENVNKSGISNEIDRICSTTPTIYSNRDRVARINSALDKYWFLVSESAPKGTFDDTNIASLPVETQNLVSGTNSYKMTAFTNKVLQILRISILDDDADERDLIYEEFEDIFEFNELYSTDAADRGTPSYWTKMGDYIYLRPSPNYAETNGLRAYVNREMSKFAFVTCTVTAATDLINATAHGLTTNDTVIFETDTTIPAGITADTTQYYVIASGLTVDVFKVSTTKGGSTIDITDTGTGNHTFLKTNKEPGIPVIHHTYLARYASLPYLIEKKLPQKNDIMALIQQDEKEIKAYWSQYIKDERDIITMKQRAYK